ncbi:MAG TPA: NAD-dependent epimerase/dehydratase family protein [Thermodesulfobacteriota bacterium]|nr:NAD-dependent epimerase/dehydratase family protein [Thermodesulfobacteriota bacterium]
MVALVTGAGGFIGRHLAARLLARGEQVRALDLHLGRLPPADRLERLEGDLRLPEVAAAGVRGAEVVYHLASAHLAVSVPERHYWSVNVDGSVGLFLAARRAGVRRFVHVSSVGVYGPLGARPADETTPCAPVTLYERTKHAAELALAACAADGGPELVVARPAWTYGEGCPRTARLFRAVARRRFLMIGRGDTRRHPIAVEDLCAGLVLAAHVPHAAGRTYVLAGDEVVTLRELLATIAAVLGVEPPSVRVPVALAAPVAAVVEGVGRLVGVEPPFSRRSLIFFTQHYHYDTSRARRELGFAPAVRLAEGMASVRERLRAEGGL